MAKRSITVGLQPPLGALDRKAVEGVKAPEKKRRGAKPRKSRRY